MPVPLLTQPILCAGATKWTPRSGLGAAAAGHVFVSKVVENLINELYERYRSGEKMTIGNQKKDRRGRIIITCHLVGPQIMYADLEIKSKAPPPNGNGEVKIDGDDVAFGFGLGALFELSERTRFGVVYQSEIEPEFDGDVKISGPGTKSRHRYQDHAGTIYQGLRLSRAQ